MANDCFGNPTPYPPSISDTFADIQRWKHLSWDVRYRYHQIRTDAMIGYTSTAVAWDAYYALGAPR